MALLKRTRVALFTLLWIVWPIGVAHAWNFKGHVLIAQLAYEHLTPQAKHVADRYATTIFEHLPSRYQRRLAQYQQVSNFARIAVLPDMLRRWRLQTVFAKFDAPLPADLASLAYKNTARWHFINQPYPNAACHTIKPQNVVWAIQLLTNAMRTTQNPKSRAVIMLFLEHFMGDALQPLHAISRVDENCRGDEGGNKMCLSKATHGGRCRNNLHHLWDTGVGYVKGRVNFQRKIQRLEKEFPEADFSTALTEHNPRLWVQQNLQLANFIYSTPEGQKPASTYYRQGQSIARRQIALAGYRLADLLNRLLK